MLTDYSYQFLLLHDHLLDRRKEEREHLQSVQELVATHQEKTMLSYLGMLISDEKVMDTLIELCTSKLHLTPEEISQCVKQLSKESNAAEHLGEWDVYKEIKLMEKTINQSQ